MPRKLVENCRFRKAHDNSADNWQNIRVTKCRGLTFEHVLVLDKDQAKCFILTDAHRLFPHHKPGSIGTVKPSVSVNLAGRRVIGTAAELDAKGKAIRIEVFTWKPVTRHVA